MTELRRLSTGDSGEATFVTTHWTMVLAAGQAALPALEKLCRSYWRPVYAFVRRRGYSVEEAQDLTQGFFARLLERGDLQNVQREKGRFRSYLLMAVKHFVANEWHRARAEKRGGTHTIISLGELQSEHGDPFELVETTTPEDLFERRWAWSLLAEVLSRLEKEFNGNRDIFERWKRALAGEVNVSQAEMAAGLGVNENALKQAFYRLRQRYQQLLREEIANTVAMPGDIEDELRYLIAVLRR